MPNKERLSGRRVLIAEDEAMVAIDLEYSLQNAGCRIAGIAGSLERAYALLEMQEFDFAVLDVNLGGKNVFPFAQKLRAQGLPFFFVTGYRREQIIPKEFRECACLEKPLGDDVLLRTAASLFPSASPKQLSLLGQT